MLLSSFLSNPMTPAPETPPALTVAQIQLYYEGNCALGCLEAEAAEQYWRDVPALLGHLTAREQQVRQVLRGLLAEEMDTQGHCFDEGMQLAFSQTNARIRAAAAALGLGALG